MSNDNVLHREVLRILNREFVSIEEFPPVGHDQLVDLIVCNAKTVEFVKLAAAESLDGENRLWLGTFIVDESMSDGYVMLRGQYGARHSFKLPMLGSESAPKPVVPVVPKLDPDFWETI